MQTVSTVSHVDRDNQCSRPSSADSLTTSDMAQIMNSPQVEHPPPQPQDLSIENEQKPANQQISNKKGKNDKRKLKPLLRSNRITDIQVPPAAAGNVNESHSFCNKVGIVPGSDNQQKRQDKLANDEDQQTGQDFPDTNVVLCSVEVHREKMDTPSPSADP